MSESQNYEEATVASNGVTVIKTFEEDAFPVPAIAFRIKSDRTETVTVRLVDEVPDNVAVEDLGFHPEYGSEHWTIEDDEITFERELESEEQYTTVYGIRATGTDDVSQFLTEPTIADVDPPLEDEDGVVGGSGSDVVRDVISGNADSVPGLDDDDEEIGTLDLADPNADEEAEDDEDEADEDEATDDEPEESEDDEAVEEETADESEDADDADDGDEEESDVSSNGAMTDVESIAAALATEIREDEVADDDLELIRDELELEAPADSGGDASGGAADARIQRLQTEVSDLQAYTDALEEFLEEEGTGEDLINDVQEQVESVEAELETVQDLESQVEEMESQLEGVDDVDEQLSALESDVDDHEGQFGTIDDELDELETDLKSLKADIKDLDDDVEDLQDDMTTVENELDGIENVDEQVADIEDDIEELKEWREQLSNVLGAADGGD
jgi:outer membrane murein-binding lipoprotein Lpp